MSFGLDVAVREDRHARVAGAERVRDPRAGRARRRRWPGAARARVVAEPQRGPSPSSTTNSSSSRRVAVERARLRAGRELAATTCRSSPRRSARRSRAASAPSRGRSSLVGPDRGDVRRRSSAAGGRGPGHRARPGPPRPRGTTGAWSRPAASRRRPHAARRAAAGAPARCASRGPNARTSMPSSPPMIVCALAAAAWRASRRRRRSRRRAALPPQPAAAQDVEQLLLGGVHVGRRRLRRRAGPRCGSCPSRTPSAVRQRAFIGPSS